MTDDSTQQEMARTLPYGGAPAENVLTAGQPTPDHLARLGAIGCVAVVDLRAAGEPRGYDEPKAVAAAGMEYVHIPVTTETLTDREFDQLREYLREHGERPVLVHCASANRVGALLVPFFMLDQKRSRDDAIAAAQRVGMRSADLLQKALAYVAARS